MGRKNKEIKIDRGKHDYHTAKIRNKLCSLYQEFVKITAAEMMDDTGGNTWILVLWASTWFPKFNQHCMTSSSGLPDFTYVIGAQDDTNRVDRLVLHVNLGKMQITAWIKETLSHRTGSSMLLLGQSVSSGEWNFSSNCSSRSSDCFWHRDPFRTEIQL